MWKPQANEKVELMHSTRITGKSVAITPCPKNQRLTASHGQKMGRKNAKMEAKGSLIPAQSVAEFETPEKLRKEDSAAIVGRHKRIDPEMCWEESVNGAHHFCPGPQERLDV
uniref:Uncharacterized protein n=1 Tax=Ditylenchus dipsaci TaxID=166011 RepID=A0A915D818_9BILA